MEVTAPGDHESLALTMLRYPMPGYCGSGDPGRTADIAPVEPSVVRVLAS